jgi:hypothetical protein
MLTSPSERFGLLLAFLAAIGVAATLPATAGPCELDLQDKGSVAITVNGAQGANEWSMAGTFSSGTSGCLDQVQPISGSRYDITVRSMRYTDGGTEYIGLLFEVPDQSTMGTKEDVYVYFDPDQGGGSDLSTNSGKIGKDYRLKLQHEWNSQQSSSQLQSTLDWGKPASSIPPNCSVKPFTPASTPTNLEAAVQLRGNGPGYVAEMRIPVQALGNPSSDIRIGLAVVDEQGTNMQPGSGPDTFVASFPQPLPSGNQGANPRANCSDKFHAPNNWGVGVWLTMPADVTISRDEVYWNSEAIEALQCGEMTTYEYHPNGPCELTLEATIQNSRNVALNRNVLYLWADHGANPMKWRFIDLQETSVPDDGSRTVTSEMWSQVPSGLFHHPCVRAYILPDNLNQGNWDRQRVENISTNQDLSQMMNAYNLSTANWAQKNISKKTSGQCEEGCRVAGSGAPGAVQPDRWGDGNGLLFWGGLLGLLVGLIGGIVQVYPRRRLCLAAGMMLMTVLAMVVACTPFDEIDDDEQEQEVPVLMTPSEFARSHPGNAIVQMQVFGTIPVDNPDPDSANFYDVMGGVIRLIPTDRVADQGREGISVELQVSNTEEAPRRLTLNVKTVLPPKLQAKDSQLAFDQEREEPVILEPGESQTLQGRLVLRKAKN